MSMDIKVKKGALHKQLGISSDKSIPAGDLAIKPGDSTLTKKRKTFAKNAKKWNHSGPKASRDQQSQINSLIKGKK